MSTKISKRQFSELIQTLIRKEIEEVSTTASAGIDGTGTGHYDTPRAFSGKGKDRRSKISSGSGYEKVNEGVTEKLHTYVVESGWWADASDKTKANYIKQHGSPPNTATDDTAGDPDDAWDDEEAARAQAKKDMEDEFDFDFDESVSINESAVSFWQDMFRPGPIPKKYITQLIKKRGELPSKKHIKRIYRDNGNPSSSELAKSWKLLTKEKYVRAASGMWRWNKDFTGWESVNEDKYEVYRTIKNQRATHLLKTLKIVQQNNFKLPKKVKPKMNTVSGIIGKDLPVFAYDVVKVLKKKDQNDPRLYHSLWLIDYLGSTDPKWTPTGKVESVNEDAKDVAKARKISRQLEKIEGKYRKAMYDLSDRLQADPKNHKLQDDLINSYTKHITAFMRDMVKITKRVK